MTLDPDEGHYDDRTRAIGTEESVRTYQGRAAEIYGDGETGIDLDSGFLENFR